MENIALLSFKFGIPFVPTIANSDVLNSRWQCSPFLRGGSGARMRQRRCAVSAVRGDGEDEGSKVGSKRVLKKMDVYDFARISTSNSSEISTASAAPQLPGPPPPSYIGSPLFWIGVGVGISALFSVVATK